MLMENMKGLLLGVFVLFVTISCEQRDTVSPELLSEGSLIFGDFYGECLGDGCVDIYKLDQNAHRLYEDKSDVYPTVNQSPARNYVLLDDSLYQLVKDLPGKVPTQLFAEKDTVIGQPDAGDWGGYYLEITHNEERKFWLIDKKKDNLPTYLQSFVDEMEAKLAVLQ